jgi:peptide/nickel transport system substrate-binding protein
MLVVDWATLLKMRGQPEQWDIFVTHHSFSPDPLLLTFLNASYPGWWDSPELGSLRAELIKSTDPAARKSTWDKVQALIYEQVPVMKVGDAYTYDIASPKLRGLNPNGPVFWNVSPK